MKANVIMAKPDNMSDEQIQAVIKVVSEVTRERFDQHTKWGEQNHPDFPVFDAFDAGAQKAMADEARDECQKAFAEGTGSYYHILNEEIAEAYAEYDDPQALRKELIQAAAVAVAWVEKIDRDAKKAEEGKVV